MLFVHGSQGGSDQGALMGRFLVVSEDFRVVAPSRPGYLRTRLSELTAPPDAQADLLARVM